MNMGEKLLFVLIALRRNTFWLKKHVENSTLFNILTTSIAKFYLRKKTQRTPEEPKKNTHAGK